MKTFLVPLALAFILGRRRTTPGVPVPGSPQVTIGYPGGAAGSPDIARASGGDALSVNDAAAVEATFERIRRRYAIYFYAPDGVDTGRAMELDLSDAARRKHPDAALQYRQVTLAKDGAKPGLITRVPAHPALGRDPEPIKADTSEASSALARRRPGVSDSTGPQGPLAGQPAVEPPPAGDPAPPKVAVRRVSEPDNTPRVVILPVQ